MPAGQTKLNDSFGARSRIAVGDRSYEVFRLDALQGVGRLPFSLKILLENLLRNEDGVTVTASDVEALAAWDPTGEADKEIAFAPARILMQDFTGVPAVVDLAAMRDAMTALGGDPARVNPLIPAELVIDHSVIADFYGSSEAFSKNAELEFERNEERYRFLRWGQNAFDTLKVVPPDTGICHQVNLEHLARVVFTDDAGRAYPDTLLGTDSHTTMINGLGVLGWGVGGIEAEAAMLGQPVSMLTPRVVGFELRGELPAGSTATDLVLTVTEMLRSHGVVGKFVEFYGEGVSSVPLANRATIGNMSPEYGSTCAIFPIDGETLRYLRLTGRSPERVALVEAYAKEQGLWHDPTQVPEFSERLSLDLSQVVPSIAGPSRPQDRVRLDEAAKRYPAAVAKILGADASSDTPTAPTPVELEDGTAFDMDHGHVVIAAITSCTNTSNPSVMVAAGLLAKKAVEKGLISKPWVKTTLAPGSKVVMEYLEAAGLVGYLEKLGFSLVGYGCTTCIGNSGPLPAPISAAINSSDLAAVAVLSGNRNFEGRISPDVRMNYLASPPLVVAYALAGSMALDLTTEPLGYDPDGRAVHLSDVWPSPAEVAEVVGSSIRSEMFASSYESVYEGDDRWRSLQVPDGDAYVWDSKSTYVRKPPYFDGMTMTPEPLRDILGARVLAKLADSVTTDHISPAGNIRRDGPAGMWLTDGGVDVSDFNSFGARRGNHEVMIRGTFANIRLRNQLAPGTEGGVTRHLPDGQTMPIYDASMRYQADGVPLVILAGKEYGSGSSRDWAAKGTALLGVKAVLAESFERIHRSNLVGMGIAPLQYLEGDSAENLGLTGEETFDVKGLAAAGSDGPMPREVALSALRPDGTRVDFNARLRIDTPKEADYYRHGGILLYVLRQLRGD
ncbi:MAG: aconitate hydratase AcnA [Acidimicrobiales bacterium]